MERARRADAAVEAHERGLRWCARKHDLGPLARERVAPGVLDRVGDEVVDAGDVEVEGVERSGHGGCGNSGATGGGESSSSEVAARPQRGEQRGKQRAKERAVAKSIVHIHTEDATLRDSLDIRLGLMLGVLLRTAPLAATIRR